MPIKAFSRAKLRLGSTLSPEEREQLARKMASAVVEAAAPLAVTVATDDQEVADWARLRGADVAWTPGLGLNGAVQAGMVHLAGNGFDRATVAHGDLPLASGLEWLGSFPGITLVPDRREDGTNVISLPCSGEFRFSYGVGSFQRHYQEALRLGLEVRVLRPPELTLDIDIPDDLVTLAAMKRPS